MAASTEALIAEFASAPTLPLPPPSPLSPWSSPLPQIPSPPLPLPSPPTHTSLTYADAPLGYKAAMIQLRATSPPHVPSPPLLLPSADHRSDNPKTDLPFQKRLCLTAPASSIRAFESRVMTVMEEVNERVSDLATTQRQDDHELHMRNEDAQDHRALLRAQISLLMRESTALKASISTLEAQVRTLQTQHDRMEWQRQQVGDMMTSAFGRIHALEARDRARTGDARP
ncbi:hypothetical protein Tco_1496841 [Tanacetum coccineum]